MRKSILMVLLAVASGNAAAEWTVVSADEPLNVYVDVATIRRSGVMVKIWTLVDYSEARKLPSGQSYLSAKSHYEFDCKGESYRISYITSFAEKMGNGAVLVSVDTPSKWAPVEPESIAKSIMNVACGKK